MRSCCAKSAQILGAVLFALAGASGAHEHEHEDKSVWTEVEEHAETLLTTTTQELKQVLERIKGTRATGTQNGNSNAGRAIGQSAGTVEPDKPVVDMAVESVDRMLVFGEEALKAMRTSERRRSEHGQEQELVDATFDAAALILRAMRQGLEGLVDEVDAMAEPRG